MKILHAAILLVAAGAGGTWFALQQILHLAPDARYVPWIVPAATGSKAVLLILLLALLVRVAVMAARRLGWRHGRVLLFFILAHLLLNTPVTPLHGEFAMLNIPGRNSGETALIAPIYKSYIWIRQFSFSSMDYAFWAALPAAPTGFESPALQFLATVVQAPSADATSYYRLLAFILFSCGVAASFGFYLYLRLGFAVTGWIAATAGLLAVLGNFPFHAKAVQRDFFIFQSAFAVLPFALLCVRLALLRNCRRYAVAAGAALATPYLILAPHPEYMLYVLAMVAVVGASEGMMSPLSWQQKFSLGLATALSFFALSLFALAPPIWAAISGEATFFSHSNEHPGTLHIHGPSIPWMLIGTLSFLALFLRQRREKKWDAHLLALGGLMLLWLPSENGVWGLLVMALHLPFNLDCIPRDGMLAVSAAIVLTAVAVNSRLPHAAFMQSLLAHRRATLGVIIVLMLIAAWFIPPLYNHENPKRCNYYTLVSTALANLKLLSHDPANLAQLRRTFARYEQHASAGYAALLKLTGVRSAAELDDAAFLRFASDAAPIVDAYFLGECKHPYLESLGQARRVYQLNQAALFAGLDSPYRRIAGLMKSADAEGYGAPSDLGDLYLGIGPGLFIHNGSTTYDARFISGPPLLHRLYLMPGHTFEAPGGYNSNTNWRMDHSLLLNPAHRKRLEIGGIQYFAVPQEHAREIAALPGMRRVTPPHPPALSVLGRTAVFHYTRAYDMAYLANRAQWQPAAADEAAALDALKDRHDIVLEGPADPALAPGDSGTVNILGIAGEAAVFDVTCTRPRCAFVYNVAALTGWRVYAAGAPLPTARANYAFLAALIPEGRHEVWAVYQPTAPFIAWVFSIFCWLAVLLCTIRRAR